MRPKKILFINPFGIGDLLHTTPMIRAVKEAYPESFIAYWCNQRTQGLLKNNRLVDKIFALSRGDIKKIYKRSKTQGILEAMRLFSALRKVKFDVALDFSLDHRYGLVSLLAGIKKRIGFDYKKRGRFLTDKVPMDGYNSKHVVDYYFELLKALGIKPETYNLEFPSGEASKRRIELLLSSLGIKPGDILIGVFPGGGASWGNEASNRHWSGLKFAQVADSIIENFGAKIVILGDPGEKGLSDSMIFAMKNKPIDMTGKVPLEDLSALLSSLKILISNDGGPLHMACAAGLKTVSVFGPVDERVYGPYPASSKHLVVKSAVACRPCYKNFRMPFCDNDKECLKSIRPEEVFNAVRRLL